MKYMLMIHQGTTPTPLDPAAWATLPADEQQAIYAAYQEINATPGVTPGEGLQSPDTATTVRVKDGKTITTDGPFVDTKEALNGFLIFETDDLLGLASEEVALSGIFPGDLKRFDPQENQVLTWEVGLAPVIRERGVTRGTRTHAGRR